MNLEFPPSNLSALHQWISKKEESHSTLKPEAKASIIWANTEQPAKTTYSILYLHGFKASHGEGFPIHNNIAKKLGCNLYLPRLKKHGLNDPDAFKNLHSNDLISSAVEAFTVAQQLGNQVIIMGTSTGASLALYLAAQPEFKQHIASLILYSPLIKFYGVQSLFLTTGIGRKIIKLFTPKNYMIGSINKSKRQDQIWYSSYHIQGALALGFFVEKYMTASTFKKVECPVFTGFYYKNFWNRDKVVSVKAIEQMHLELGTKDLQKEMLQLTNAQTHVISCGLVSKSVGRLEDETLGFLQKHLVLNQL